MKKVAGYARVSTIQQTEGTSLEIQKQAIEDRCKKEEWFLTEIYADEGISGSSMKRPALQKLLEDAKTNQFEMVLFTKLDRLGRSSRDIHNIYHRLKKELNIDLFCIDDPSLNTTGKMGTFMISMLASIAELEKETIKERMGGGRIAKWKQGSSFMGSMPYGYERTDKAINETEAKIYQRMIDMYLIERKSVTGIAMQLTIENIPTPSESKGRKSANKSGHWRAKTILNMLRNSVYTGEAIYNKKICKTFDAKGKTYTALSKELKPVEENVIVSFPPLISIEKWQEVQDRIDQQKKKPKRIHKKYPEKFLLDGNLYCGECGGRMRKLIYEKPSGVTGFRYICHWHMVGKDELILAGRTRCNMKPVNADEIDSRLFSQISHLLTHPHKFAQNWFKDQDVKELQDKVASMQEKEEELQQQIKNGIDGMMTTKHPDDKQTFHEAISKARSLLNSVHKELIKTQKDIDSTLNKQQRLQDFGSKFILQTKEIGLLETLPFHDKRKITDAIIAPESGGKVFVGYVKAEDVFDHDDSKEEQNPWSIIIPEGGRNIEKMQEGETETKPLIDGQIYISGDFVCDVDRIEAVITGLNKGNLLKEVNVD